MWCTIILIIYFRCSWAKQVRETTKLTLPVKCFIRTNSFHVMSISTVLTINTIHNSNATKIQVSNFWITVPCKLVQNQTAYLYNWCRKIWRMIDFYNRKTYLLISSTHVQTINQSISILRPHNALHLHKLLCYIDITVLRNAQSVMECSY